LQVVTDECADDGGVQQVVQLQVGAWQPLGLACSHWLGKVVEALLLHYQCNGFVGRLRMMAG
jgi:hypothetical protein